MGVGLNPHQYIFMSSCFVVVGDYATPLVDLLASGAL